MSNRKRNKPYQNRNHNPKRRRPYSAAAEEDDDQELVDIPREKEVPPPALVVMGLPDNCSVLDLKSRFEVYGSISRIRIDRDGAGIVAFRTSHSAEAAMAASLDASFRLTLHSHQVQVLWASDPLAKWREAKKSDGSPPSSSKLLRPEVPLSRHGRSNKLASTIVNPNKTVNPDKIDPAPSSDPPFRGREIVAYDDIL